MDQEEELERIKMKRMEELMQKQATVTAGPMVLSDATFEKEVSSHSVMLVDFWAEWCPPCRMIAPVIEQLAGEYAGRVTFGKVNVDDNPMVAQAFGIQSIPTLLVFKDGRVVNSIIGAVPKARIERAFQGYLPAA
jgi:thioredoxin 1